MSNVLDALPKSIQPLATKKLHEIRDAGDKDHTRAAAKALDAEFRPKWPKAADRISEDPDQVLRFFDFPAEHWVHLSTTNAIESTFATVRLRTRVTKGPGSRAASMAVAFQILEAAEDRWRSVNGRKLVASVRAGARFRKGGARRELTARRGRRRVINETGSSTTLDDSSMLIRRAGSGPVEPALARR